MELISKIGGTILVVGMLLAVWKSETYLAKSLKKSRDSHEIAKTEPTISKMEQVEDDAYFLELMGAVERGEISDAGANQAWYEYINHKDEPQTDCAWK